MAKTIPQLTDATTVNAADELIVQQGGITKRATAAELGQGLAPSVNTANGTVNVRDFGAKGDGVTDDTAAIQAAINANPSKAIYFPSGDYNITSQIRVSRIWTGLVGDAAGTRILVAFDSNEPAILVKSDLGPAFPNIFGFQMENLGIWKTVANNNTSSIGLELFLADAVKLHHCEIVGFSTALLILGGRNCYYSNLRLSAFNPQPSTWPTGVSIVKIARAGTGPAWSAGTSYSLGDNVKTGNRSYTCTVAHTSGVSFDATKWARLTGFTHMFENCIISSGFTHDYAFHVESNDYCSVANSYLSGATVAIVRLGGPADFCYDNWFDHCYFDGGRPYSEGPSPLGVWISEMAEPSGLHNFTDCSFGQMKAAMFVDDEELSQVGVVGCRFNYCYESGISLSSNAIDFRLSGCAFQNSCSELEGKACVQINDAKTVAISGNVFNFNLNSYPSNTRAIAVASTATLNSLSITGNTFDSSSANVSDIISTGATIGRYVVAGNASNNSSVTATGLIVGNQNNASTRSLDWYEEGTWTPTLQFGGATTDITYTTRVGSWTRIGNRVYFDCFFTLSSKGSATGNATIDGLPFPQASVHPSTYTVSVGALNSALSDGNMDAGQNNSNLTSMFLYKQVSGSRAVLQHSDVENNSNFAVTGTYRV
jgi:hypothetical protein